MARTCKRSFNRYFVLFKKLTLVRWNYGERLTWGKPSKPLAWKSTHLVLGAVSFSPLWWLIRWVFASQGLTSLLTHTGSLFLCSPDNISCLLALKKLLTLIYFVCGWYMCPYTCHGRCVESRGRFAGVRSSCTPCRPEGSNPRHQVWWQKHFHLLSHLANPVILNISVKASEENLSTETDQLSGGTVDINLCHWD